MIDISHETQQREERPASAAFSAPTAAAASFSASTLLMLPLSAPLSAPHQEAPSEAVGGAEKRQREAPKGQQHQLDVAYVILCFCPGCI